ncbi:Monooxygenase, FAD binding [Herminiimonas arsenicoxydans]|uniref:Monooxygenase, FAD binding n=1 Tax=Herminiimonas arsenicoxydans TaxID=204773 RepID=A4G7Z3_HERAR|nr:Monooxygenase, FAD binding [Herminiimonas arsenicoxydans]
MLNELHTRCCIVGGGPAGMMLGLLLARAGVDVIVLEKHGDFLRDFRGDTVHPSTLQIMHELGLLQAFLLRPHDKAYELSISVAGQILTIADFSRLHTQCNFIALMPQWEFLDFLRDHAVSYPHFHLLQNAEATTLQEQDGYVTGVHVETADGPLLVNADLTIGADGRHSAVRKAAGLVVRDLGAPIDVLWMRLPMAAGDPSSTGARLGAGQFFVMLNRGSYWQCAYVIPKGGITAIRARGLHAFHAELAAVAPLFTDRVQLLQSWDDIKLLSVTVDRLEHWWKPGLLCIGDAAHAMSPVGGVGINLAIQDAVATANILSRSLANPQVQAKALTPLLKQVQSRRLFPARITQAVQVAIQNRVLVPVIGKQSTQALTIPWPLKLLNRWPVLRKIPAYAVGIGVQPEHILDRQAHAKLQTPARPASK